MPDARRRANRTCGRRDRRRASPGPDWHRPATGRATPWKRNRRREIEQPVANQQPHFGSSARPAGAARPTGRPAAEIPRPVHALAEQLVRTIRPPIEFARGDVDRSARQRRHQRIAGRIAEMRVARIRIGIDARDRGVVAPGHRPLRRSNSLRNSPTSKRPASLRVTA